MPTNGAPTGADLDRTVRLIRHKAARLGSATSVEFSLAGLKLASAEQIRWVEEQVRESPGLRVDWVRHS